ncbi:MAG: hypothetical protein M3169_07380 [Candidatus Eremiobacteraeota bacterium]|nr:hypothetical protein [Candidatus Eremiobacteraeota bacterium]
MSVVPFRTFVDALDRSLRSCADDGRSVVLEEQPAEAVWISGPFRAGVRREDLSVRAWIGLEGHVAHEFHEPLTPESARRLGEEFAALLGGPDEP